MKIFECPNCKSPLFFENATCQNCNTQLGYNPYLDNFQDPNNNQGNYTKFCSNYKYGVCNWLVDDSENPEFCLACSLNRVVPNRSNIDHFQKWNDLEIAKHRLVYQLLKLRLPVYPKLKYEDGVTFDFLSENNDENVLTGHANGVVTIILTEADSVKREQLRKQMNESYRTLLGDFRHEIGHYYWELLFNQSNVESFRMIFGDERADYSESLDNHYKNGAPENWNENYISAYASSHPWEDWAETWAHYLHLMDTLETSNYFGLSFNPENDNVKKLVVNTCPNPYLEADFKVIFKASVSLTCMANSLNRSMGLPDIYPFVVPDNVVEKLSFIHELLKSYRNTSS
ncbi:zinc-binding metallopeptidase family protein [Formosa haliotis]|uniref:zinc-binding metallopeptidase family protein n=1 Tax=Formosa haliotis TaxID=1555194 RepID=UPI000826743F|nr:putative zinc-binding metallopeptidase [Formosa haliotis]